MNHSKGLAEFVFLSIALALAAGAASSGCEANVTAVEPTEAPYTLYAVLNPMADTQWVRVIPIVDRLTSPDQPPVAETVRSIDLGTGESVLWTLDATYSPSSTDGWLFMAPLDVVYSHTYRLEATRSDGAVSSAEVTIPSESAIHIGDGQTSYPASIPVDVIGKNLRLLHVELVYHLDYRYAAPVPADVPLPDPVVRLDYSDLVIETEDGWHIPVNLSADFVRLFIAIQTRSGARVNRLYGLRIRDLTVSFLAASQEWNPPGGIFDPEVLVQPGTMSNVVNGFGFVGAGYRMSRTWLPDDEIARAAGFVVPRDTAESQVEKR